MKNSLLPMIVLFCSTTIYSQVGVNTTSPKSTLDITAKNAIGTSTNADGILIPRVDRQRALSMTSVEPSTLIYVNNISTATATGQASNIDAIGFYYFDGSTSKWTKLNIGGVTADFTPDAFIDNSANSMVKLGTTSSGGSRASGSDFVIKDNGSVGIGIASPKAKLDISGTDSGVRLPQLTTAQRDAIASDRAHTATLLYNKDINKLQVNVGTDTNRIWATLGSMSETLNTSATFTSNASQTITYTSPNNGDRVRFQSQIYNSTPAGYISKVNNNTDFVLKGGRTYKVDVNMGRLKTSDAKHTWCHVFDTAGSEYASVSVIPQSYTLVNWNSANTMSTYITIPEGSTKTIYVKCAKQDSGNVIINDAIAPQISLTIMD
ncbi:hypothetical protein NZD88_04300 [Chryseobacterium antibioticum]|uniref:Uncharacterized protein n=1 Tax=Chryseobacterium pyrolae TaxID=2987481 RepID=A0ABT2IES7_9FLAO|nr:hypothetical protein [Chryseobacterium pyrolae]MCT2406777.1 hypothetical protein [Chryseobacterium pyrolae]